MRDWIHQRSRRGEHFQGSTSLPPSPGKPARGAVSLPDHGILFITTKPQKHIKTTLKEAPGSNFQGDQRVGSGGFPNIAGRVGSGKEVCEIPLVGSGRVGSGRVGSGQEVFKSYGSTDPREEIRPVKSPVFVVLYMVCFVYHDRRSDLRLCDRRTTRFSCCKRSKKCSCFRYFVPT